MAKPAIVTGTHIRTANKMVIHGIRPWIMVDEGGSIYLQLNAPGPGDEVGAVIAHGGILAKELPETLTRIEHAIRGWVMGQAACIAEAEAAKKPVDKPSGS